jgi:hypothetical protein
MVLGGTEYRRVLGLVMCGESGIFDVFVAQG